MHLAECGITKPKLLKQTGVKLNQPSHYGEGFLDIEGSHCLGETAMKTGLYNLGRIGASKAIKSDLMGIANKYLDQALDSVTLDISRSLDPLHKGSGVNIHKALL